MSLNTAKTTLIGSWFNNNVIAYGTIDPNIVPDLEGKVIENKFYLGIDIYMINDPNSGAVEIVFRYMNANGNIDSEKCLAYYDKCKKKFVFNTNSLSNIIFKDIVIPAFSPFFYNGELRINSNGNLDIKMNMTNLFIKGTVNSTLKKEPKCL